MTVVPLSAIPSPALIVGPEGRIGAANDAARAVLGDVVGRPVQELMVGETETTDGRCQPLTLQGLDATYATRSEAFDEGTLVLLTDRQPPGTLAPPLLARDHIARVFDASAAPLGLLERVDGGVVHTLGNEAARVTFGVVAGERPGRDWQRAVVSARSQPVRFDIGLDDGRTLEVVLSPVRSDRREEFLYMATDVTDGREATEDLLHVSNRQLQQIAQDIHDGVGQSLVGASMLASALARELGESPQAAEAARVQALLGRSLGQLRSFALGLDPVDIDRLGVGEALTRLAAEARDTFNIDIRVEDRVGERGVRPDARLDVYRVAQEALTNAVRHGSATAVRLALYPGLEGNVVLDVVDDGCGIAAGASASGGMGMRTMRARAQRHGGGCVVEPLDGGGTRVRLRIPLERLFTS